MTQGRLLFAALTTGYILIALQLEERDLLRDLGDDYAAYQRRVPMLIPGLKRR
jgi:protein-S-isoprenylcysteine O-methyltransferase Ste14